MKGPTSSPSKSPPKARDLGVGRWGAMQIIVFCSILALVSVLTSVVIGSLMGGTDGILVALAISAVIVMIFGSIALALVALGSLIDTMRGMGRRAASPSNMGGGGVSDEWLDGPA
jgi:hypothetical protein